MSNVTNTATAKAPAKRKAAAPKATANTCTVAPVVAAQATAVAKAGGPGTAGKLAGKVYTSAPQGMLASTVSTAGCKAMPANGPSQQRFAASTVAGASLYTASVVQGLCIADLRYWAKCGHITITPPTQAQVVAMVAHWQSTQGGKATT